MVKPSDGKNHVEPIKNEKFFTKTYTFEVTKCDKIFDLLVFDDQIVVSKRLKTLPLEQRKKIGFLSIILLNVSISRIW